MNFYLKTFLFILAASFTSYFFHDWWVTDPFILLIKVYSFLGTATFVTVCGLRVVHRFVPDKLGYGFLALIFVKCGAAIVLFPELIAENPRLSKAELLNFIAPYFIFLFVEVGIVIKWLNDN